MNLNKCERCGCFFTSKDYVCPNCASKDLNEISELKNFLVENDKSISIENLSLSTGISVKNVNRFLKNEEINNTFSDLGLITNNCNIEV